MKIQNKISNTPFDIDLKEDLDYLKYNFLKEIEEWLIDDFEFELYNLLNEQINNKYYSFYTDAINCIFQSEEYKKFLSNPKNTDLSLGIKIEILLEEKEREQNAEHNPKEE